MKITPLKMKRDDASSFSCHNCLQPIPKYKPLFFMNDRVFCSSRCRLCFLATEGDFNVEKHPKTMDGDQCRAKKRGLSRVSSSLNIVSEADQRQASSGSMYSYLTQLSSWFSLDSFF